MAAATVDPAPLSLMGLWLRHRDDCRPVGDIMADARAGRLPGVTPTPRGFGFIVTDVPAALAAMKKEAA